MQPADSARFLILNRVSSHRNTFSHKQQSNKCGQRKVMLTNVFILVGKFISNLPVVNGLSWSSQFQPISCFPTFLVYFNSVLAFYRCHTVSGAACGGSLSMMDSSIWRMPQWSAGWDRATPRWKRGLTSTVTPMESSVTIPFKEWNEILPKSQCMYTFFLFLCDKSTLVQSANFRVSQIWLNIDLTN